VASNSGSAALRTRPTPSVPMTAAVSLSWASACAVHSAIEVLPLVPVTPTVNMLASGMP
jgi:hypothetical protein